MLSWTPSSVRPENCEISRWTRSWAGASEVAVASAASVEYRRGWILESTERAFFDIILVLGARRDCATGRLATLVTNWTLRAASKQRRLWRDKVVFNMIRKERTAAR